jgi:hypothetical protein
MSNSHWDVPRPACVHCHEPVPDPDIVEAIAREFVRAMRRRLIPPGRWPHQFWPWLYEGARTNRARHAMLHQFMTVYGRLRREHGGDEEQAAHHLVEMLREATISEAAGDA